MIFKVGITGGIGSGKSSVTALFAQLGVPTFSSDVIARELSQPGEGPFQAIVELFGGSILASDGAIDRSALGDIVFNDGSKLRQLEQILHPAIFALMHRRAEAQSSPYCVLDIPLLVGTAEQAAVDRVLVVSTRSALRQARVQQRSGWSAAKTRAVMAAQLSEQTLLAAADDVIQNNDTLEDLKPRVEQLHQRYLKLAANQ